MKLDGQVVQNVPDSTPIYKRLRGLAVTPTNSSFSRIAAAKIATRSEAFSCCSVQFAWVALKTFRACLEKTRKYFEVVSLENSASRGVRFIDLNRSATEYLPASAGFLGWLPTQACLLEFCLMNICFPISPGENRYVLGAQTYDAVRSVDCVGVHHQSVSPGL